MLFVPVQPRNMVMWMKDTFIPLDMIFFNASGRIVYIHPNAQPMNQSLISAYQPVAGVIEINAGLCQRLGISEGDQVLGY